MRSVPSLLIPFAALAITFGAGCKSGQENSSSAATSASSSAAGSSSASASSTAEEQPPVSKAEIQGATNPDKQAPYVGPTGSVKGRVRITGDGSPPLDLGETKIPLGTCLEAHQTYKSLFREGPERALADVLVAVTGYQGYVAPPAPTIKVTAKGCAFETRTVALMLGQGIEVQNRGPSAVTPQLLGVRTQALLIAIPGGDPIKLFPQQIGLHRLIDRSNEFAFADVYVVPYPTTRVTGLDGQFEITGIPVGAVKVNALLPSLGKTLEREVTLEADQAVEVDFEFNFDAKVDLAAPAPSDAASTATPGAPAASAPTPSAPTGGASAPGKP